MNTEPAIRKILTDYFRVRGNQALVAKAFDIHPSTVKRWMDGGEIPPPMLKLLDFYFFGTIPPHISQLPPDRRNLLEFDEDEWAVIGVLARREGTTPAAWIAGRIRAYLAWEAAKTDPSPAFPICRN